MKHTLTRWTCDRCKATTESSQANTTPLGWSTLTTTVRTPDSTTTHQQAWNLCTECSERSRNRENRETADTQQALGTLLDHLRASNPAAAQAMWDRDALARCELRLLEDLVARGAPLGAAAETLSAARGLARTWLDTPAGPTTDVEGAKIRHRLRQCGAQLLMLLEGRGLLEVVEPVTPSSSVVAEERVARAVVDAALTWYREVGTTDAGLAMSDADRTLFDAVDAAVPCAYCCGCEPPEGAGMEWDGIHVELAGYARQTAAEWWDTYSLQMFRLAIPLVRDGCPHNREPHQTCLGAFTAHIDAWNATVAQQEGV